MRYREQRAAGAVRSNPRIFGTDVRAALDGVAGMVLTAIVNDKILSPLVTRRITTGFKTANNTVGQLIDAVMTLIAAQVIGFGSRYLFGDESARRMMNAGGIYGMSKGVSAFIPGLSLSAHYPDYFPGLTMGSVDAMVAANALSAGTAAPNGGGSLTVQTGPQSTYGGEPTYFTANPRPVATNADVGY